MENVSGKVHCLNPMSLVSKTGRLECLPSFGLSNDRHPNDPTANLHTSSSTGDVVLARSEYLVEVIKHASPMVGQSSSCGNATKYMYTLCQLNVGLLVRPPPLTYTMAAQVVMNAGIYVEG